MAYGKVAQFYSEQGFFLKAVAVYKQILKLDPNQMEVNVKLAELYAREGLSKEAISEFRRAAEHLRIADRVVAQEEVIAREEP